jgi:poly-gamma-glutamate capsule biosynthesis protein CapA/YwtB (metallophosphatase superfamily)
MKNDSDSARIHAIDLPATERTHAVRWQMQSILDDKDAAVRAAAVRVLAGFHHRQDAPDIARLPVQIAAAACIECSGARK